MEPNELNNAIRHFLAHKDTFVMHYDNELNNDTYKHKNSYGETYFIPRQTYVKTNVQITTSTEAATELHNLLQEPKMNKIQTQAAALQAVKQHDFIIGSFDSNGSFSAAINPTTQTSVSEARTECKRLARLSPGKAFVFLTLSGAEMVPVQTISI